MIGVADISDSDTVVRFRTDCYLFDVDKTALASLIESAEPDVYYTIPRPISAANGVCDIFGIARFVTFKKVWNISNDECKSVYGCSYNPEIAIKFRLYSTGVISGAIDHTIISIAICRQFKWVTKLDLFW
jgi:hypothetical protein